MADREEIQETIHRINALLESESTDEQLRGFLRDVRETLLTKDRLERDELERRSA